ncbi:MAG: hypothetical protein Q8J78_17555 [Moraxellaceae bacterium]|nr:hypothetical protein [Moraxellaceae bacterium]
MKSSNEKWADIDKKPSRLQAAFVFFLGVIGVLFLVFVILAGVMYIVEGKQVGFEHFFILGAALFLMTVLIVSLARIARGNARPATPSELLSMGNFFFYSGVILCLSSVGLAVGSMIGGGESSSGFDPSSLTLSVVGLVGVFRGKFVLALARSRLEQEKTSSVPSGDDVSAPD